VKRCTSTADITSLIRLGTVMARLAIVRSCSSQDSPCAKNPTDLSCSASFDHLVGAEKKIARLQSAQSDLTAKLARAAAHKVNTQNLIDRLREEIHREEGGL
jgi:peptidoglycan hydrolase CwlO-like protein